MNSVRLVDDNGATLLALGDDPVLTGLTVGYPAPREASTPLSGQDGDHDVTTYVGGRSITAEVGLQPATMYGWLDTIRGLMHPGRRYWLHVYTDAWGQERRIRVRGASLAESTVSFPWTLQLGWKSILAAFEDITPTSQTLNPVAQVAGGMVMPTAFPVTLSPGLVPGAANLTVAGNVSASPVIDMYGPCSAPLFRVVTTGAQLWFPSLSLSAGDYLHVDVAARTITLNSDPSQSRYSALDFPSASWPVLPAGTTQVVFSPTSSSAGCVAVVTWRNSYL